MKIKSLVLGLSTAALLTASAHAGIIYAGPSAEQATNSSITLNFTSSAPSTALSFTINGYASLDGQNAYEDDFSLTLNGATIYRATFNLGGGSNAAQAVVYFNPFGATNSNPTGNGSGVGWNGGSQEISFGDVLPLVAGVNTLVFSYASPTGFQGVGDEGWGVQNVSTSAPEPATWALMLAGFASLGFAASRRKAVADA